MDRVKFLMNVGGEWLGCAYWQSSEYEILGEDEKHYYIRQPNSPKNKNWVTQFLKSDEGKVYQLV